MPVDWTSHRFSGGVLALDVANTVVHRDRPDLRFDRFEDSAEIPRFAAAASVQRASELESRELRAAGDGTAKRTVIAVRETTDALFRDAAEFGHLQPSLLAPFLRATADAIASAPDFASHLDSPDRTPSHFAQALGLSALSLLPPETHRRIRICPNCAWLFLDRSRNRSRTWCDMAVCGNRSKARRHYRKRRIGEANDADVSKG